MCPALTGRLQQQLVLEQDAGDQLQYISHPQQLKKLAEGVVTQWKF